MLSYANSTRSATGSFSQLPGCAAVLAAAIIKKQREVPVGYEAGKAVETALPVDSALARLSVGPAMRSSSIDV